MRAPSALPAVLVRSTEYPEDLAVGEDRPMPLDIEQGAATVIIHEGVDTDAESKPGQGLATSASLVGDDDLVDLVNPMCGFS